MNVGNRQLRISVVITVTDVSKEVDGVRTVAVLDQDTNGGRSRSSRSTGSPRTRTGNVWYLGSYTESYEGGQFVNASDAWLAGVNGAKPGILMPADPQTGTPPFSEDTVPGIEAPTAQVVKTGNRSAFPSSATGTSWSSRREARRTSTSRLASARSGPSPSRPAASRDRESDQSHAAQLQADWQS